jgi:uncharacterized membrane protein YphA (DoxX/SURF4 family)
VDFSPTYVGEYEMEANRVRVVKPVLLILRLCVAGYLIAAGVGKLVAHDVTTSSNSPTMLAAYVGTRQWLLWLLAAVEIGSGGWLLTGLLLRSSSIATIVLLSSFTGLLGGGAKANPATVRLHRRRGPKIAVGNPSFAFVCYRTKRSHDSRLFHVIPSGAPGAV